MAPAKASASTATRAAFLAAVLVLCLAGFGSCQSAGFECWDGNYLPLTEICQTECAPDTFLDPLPSSSTFSPSYANAETFAE